MLTTPPTSSAVLTLARGGDADRFLRALVSGTGDTWGMSHGPVHITDAVQHAIRVYGPADVHLAAWWLAYRHCEDMVGLLRSRRALSLSLHLDRSMRERQVEATELLERRAVPVHWGETHAKAIALRWPDGRTLAIVTSQADPSSQSEWWHASTDPAVYAWLTSSLGQGEQDRLPQDVELAMRIQRTPYVRPKSQQDIRALLTKHACRLPLADGTTYVIGGPNIPSLALLAGIAVQMPAAPTVHLSGWWFAQRAIHAIQLLETAGIIQPPHYVASHVLDGVYGDGKASDNFARAVSPERRRFDDVHAKMALLESPGVAPVLIASTGNWQPTQPRAEIYVVTRDPAVCDMARKWLKRSL